MVERRQIRRALHLEYEFDRLLASKLELAYDILVPDRIRIIGSGAKRKNAPLENGIRAPPISMGGQRGRGMGDR